MTKVWRLLSILIIPLMCLGLMLVPGAPPQVAALGNSGLEVQPAVTTVNFTENFSVNIWANVPANQSWDTADVHLNFRPTYMNVTGITDGGSLTIILGSTFDNVAGTIDYTAGVLGTTVNGSLLVCTINFTSKSASGVSTLDFVNIEPLRVTDIIYSGDRLLDWSMVVNGTVIIGSPTLTVNVTPADKGNVTINSTITPSSYPNTTNWSWDEVVSLNATTTVPNWTFDHWSGDLSGSTNPTNITMDASKNVTANFVRYYLNVTNTTGGTVTQPGVGTFGYAEDENVTLVATNYTGYHFVNWTGNVSTIGNVNVSSTFINMTGNYSICANFAINQYNLTISSSDGGNVTTPGEGVRGPYNHSTVVNLTATPDATYNFVNWTGNVSTIANVTAANTTINMTGNYSICANFAIGGATLEGHVGFPGRGSNNTKWAELFNVTLFEAGNLTHVLWTGNATTNNTGVFTIPGLTPDTYDIGIKNWTCLSEVNTSVTLTAGNTTVVDFGTTREGDSNNDDIITGADRSLLYSGWGKSEGEGGYNGHYDFNRDGSLTGADRSLMYAC